MMKKILAAAIVSAFAAPAFAATANVDVYGKLHMSVNYFDDQPSAINDVGISSNASRIGFKGAEDLGGGLSAIWQIEQTVNLDEANAGTFASRNSFIGLKGGFGTALIGRHDTPLKLVGRSVDLFGDTMADSRNVMAGGSDTRANNVAVYMTPNMGGFGIAAAYSTDLGNSGAASDADNSGVYNLNATYNNGPLFLGLGYGDGDGHEKIGLGAHMRAAAGFTMGSLKFVGQFDKLKGDNLVINPKGDYEAWMVGGAFTMGNIVLKANYMEGDFDHAADPKQWTVGADYNLSKRSSVYALYANGENITIGGGAGTSDQVASGSASGDISVISLGMIHTF
ncbi:MAG: porin [Thiobacillus sp.]|nr:porin [Kiritimatiellota bacterium]MDZ7594109.1 porin [Thiobacillus sp.]